MTSLELGQAVCRFLVLRREVIEDRTRRLGPVEALAEIRRLATDIQDIRRENVDQIWDRVWVLPFFSGQRRDPALRRISDARVIGDLGDYRILAGACTQASHPWSVQRNPAKPKAYSVIAVGAQARAFCEGSGKYSFARHRTNPAVLMRISKLADLFAGWHQDADAGDVPFLAAMAGTDPGAGFDLNGPAFAATFAGLEGAIGPITAFHVLMDLGFPVVKPDIHVARFTANEGWFTDVDPERFARGHFATCIAAFIQLKRVADAMTEHALTANPMREIDYFIAQHGQDFGSKRPERCGR